MSWCGHCGQHTTECRCEPPGRHVGLPARCGECRLGLGNHNTADPLCDHYDGDWPRLTGRHARRLPMGLALTTAELRDLIHNRQTGIADRVRDVRGVE